LHNFVATDGAFPAPGLTIDPAGRLYGATIGSPSANCGTIFRLSTPARPGGAWGSTVLHVFNCRTSMAAGATPNGGLLLSGTGTLYGTTAEGGEALYGTVFELTAPLTIGAPWTETVLHSFASGADGAVPASGLTVGTAGLLYGTTSSGGGTGRWQCLLYGNATSCGTIYGIVP
jgi:hypothetical protein